MELQSDCCGTADSVFSCSPIQFCKLKGSKCPVCACEMPKTLVLLQTKLDFEQGEALLVIMVVLRVGNSSLVF